MDEDLLMPKERKSLEKKITHYRRLIWALKIGAVIMIPALLVLSYLAEDLLNRLVPLGWVALSLWTTPAGIKASRNLIAAYEAKLSEVIADEKLV